MQIKINLPDNITAEKTSQLIENIRNLLKKEGVVSEIEKDSTLDVDPWDELNVENIAVDTGIEDFALNHDHYLYGTLKN